MLLQLILCNLQNTLKFDILATKTKDHQLRKMVLQVVAIIVLLTFMAYIEKFINIIQNVAASVAGIGKSDN